MTHELAAALFNGVYQGIALAVVLWVGLKLFRGLNAATRHAVTFVALLVVALLPVFHLVASASFIDRKPVAVAGETNVSATPADFSPPASSRFPMAAPAIQNASESAERSHEKNLTHVVCLSTALLMIIGVGCKPAEPVGNTRHIRYVVGISPFLNEDAANESFRQIARLLLEDMPLNSSLWLYDASHLRTVAQVEIPNKHAFESSRTRANQFSDSIQKLKSFLAVRNEPPVVCELDFNQAVRLPQFMDFIGENLNQTNLSIVTLVLGSPLYQDEKEPAFSMVDDYFPSGGHLLAAPEQSVYGRTNTPILLSGITVHLDYFGDPWSSDLHRQKVSRFWNLFLKSQGAQLATITSDLPTIFNAIRSPSPSDTLRADHDELDRTQTKIEMLRVARDVQLVDWITRDLSSDHRSPSPTTLIGPMKIGILWQGDVDLDLYARAHDETEVLYFQHTHAPEGYYYKDHRSSPEREYEFIEFTEPVDVRQAQASVNFYERRTPGGMNGEILIEFQGRIYTGQFELAGRSRQPRPRRLEREFWDASDILKVLGLRSSRITADF